MIDPKVIAERNATLDRVIAAGPDAAIGWLRAAFHTHENQVAALMEHVHELRQLFLATVARPLSVREAQLCRVCRVCRTPEGAKPGDLFVYNYGDEYAHQKCLEVSG